ncbi:MAG: hypothetical protein CMC57_03220 [Flavobacteriaceae bacterium]|nr:hypothetical protein [Flavobacteriaceae bacterium]
MSKKIKIFAVIAFLMVSCSKDVTDDLQSQITQLEQTIQTLQANITTLEGQISSASAANSSLSQQLSAAQTALNNATALIAAANVDINALEASLAFAQEALEGIDYSATQGFNSVGNVADQTPTEAKKTIYGRWNIAGASKSSCSYDFLEWNDDTYILSLNLPDGEKGTIFGPYTLNEAADGTVESVDLDFDAGTSIVQIARITNIVVTESGGTINATFDIELTLPEALEVCQASLPGSVTCEKEEPMDEATTSSAISNHAKLIGKWELTDFSSSDGETIDSIKNGCDDSDGDGTVDGTGDGSECIPADRLFVTFSDFGTYSVVAVAADGAIINVEVSSWDWANASQTRMKVFFSGDDTDETDFGIYDLVTITETDLQVTGGYTDTYTELNADGTYTETSVEITETLTFARVDDEDE